MNIDRIKNFIKDECGQGMTEYALILVMASLFAIVVLSLMGDGISGLFATDQIENALPKT